MTYTFFYGGVFSQWYKRKFTVAGIEYNTAEQYMMAQKAMCFNDVERFKMIMESTNPWDQKMHGRLVEGYEEQVWGKARLMIVTEGSYQKFNQHEDLKKELLDTGNSTLVEASPFDKIWGIGLGMDDPDRHDQSKWKGQNLLGKAIMRARKKILKEIDK